MILNTRSATGQEFTSQKFEIKITVSLTTLHLILINSIRGFLKIYGIL